MMLRKQETSITTLALVVALLGIPNPLKALLTTSPALAQSPTPTTLPVPSVVPSGTTVRIDGSTSMEVINAALKQRFEQQYAGTQVELAANGTDQALQELLAGQVDLVAVGRSLTPQERAQGLVEVPISREKIAIIVGPNNAFNGNLTFEQFAKMFRGEITNWSQVGGKPGAIRFIDRPNSSDTRQALSNYQVFRVAPFKAGATTTQVSSDDTAAIVQELGNDGISYAIASQVLNQDNVKILAMHRTMPDDPRYPFSQPRGYVYKQGANPAVLGFLGFATGATGRAAIAEAKTTEAEAVASANSTEAAASPTAAGTPAVSASATPTSATPTSATLGNTTASETNTPETNAQDDNQGLPGWLLWLLVPLLGIPLLLWWLKGRGGAADVPPAVSPTTTAPVPPAADIPPGAALPEAAPPSELAARAESVISSDRAAVADAGILATGLGAAAVGAVAASRPRANSRIVLTPRTSSDAYAYWETPDAHKQAIRDQGGKELALRIYDSTGLNPKTEVLTEFQQYAIGEDDEDRHVPIPQRERDYVAEIGYLTDDHRWLSLAQSNPIHIPAEGIAADTVGAVGAASVAPAAIASLGVAGLGAVASMAEEVEEVLPPPTSRIVLTPQGSDQGYAEWNAPIEHRQELREQGGKTLALRIYDVTGVDPDVGISDQFEQYEIAETDLDRVVPIPQQEHDYLAEIGYLTDGNDWLLLARSNSIRIPAEAIPGSVAAIAGVAALASAAVAMVPEDEEQTNVEARKFDVGQTDLSAEDLADVDAGLPDLPDGYGESRIVLLPRDPQWAYAYWDVPNDHREALRHQGGQRLALRLHDVTDIDVDNQRSHSVQQYECDELARDWYLPIPVSDRDYLLEIGYLTEDGRWLVLARSNPVRIPPVYPSDWYEDQFATVTWEEDLRGRTVLKLISPSQRAAETGNPIYDEIFGMAESAEAMRVAGSLFGSMQHVAGSVFGSMQMVGAESISSFAIPSGAGMGATAPTFMGLGGVAAFGMSGIGMSGIGMGMSGIGMSGVGFAASMPPIRARKFWLVADAELIVYGATEPDATVTIAGRPVKLNSDGTFRFQMSFPDGLIDFPILAVAVDGEQTRAIHMKFNRETPERNTNSREDAKDEPY